MTDIWLRIPRSRYDFPFQMTIASWLPVIINGALSAYVTCPRCGTRGALHDHKIHADGRVSPSLDCANPNCDFHESGIALEGWNPDWRPPEREIP